MALTILPDAERMISSGLRLSADLTALVGDNIYTALPKQASARVFPLVRLARIGGAPAGTPLYLDTAFIQFDVWGGSKHEARTIAATVIAALVELVGYNEHGGYITGVDPGATRYALDDTFTPSRPRYIVDVAVHTRPTA